MQAITKSIKVVIGWRKRCPECGARFETTRRHAVTCSDRCRQRRLVAGRASEPVADEAPATVRRAFEVLA